MELDPSDPRHAVIAAGRQRLLVHGLDGLRSQLNASVLSKEVPVSRDTAYRVFRGDQAGDSVSDAIVGAVADAAHDPAWAGAQQTLERAIAAYTEHVNDGRDPHATLTAMLQVILDEQFRSPGQPVGWMLQAAALTGSPAWEGEPPPDDSVELARTILASRRAFYHQWEAMQESFFTLAMSELGRRPLVDPPTILALLHCLLDGIVLRRFIEPDAISTEQAAEALYRLGFAFTEPGPADDPRKPDDERNLALFDRLIDAADELWRSRPEITVDEAAQRAGVPPEAASLLFPDLGDLADSLVRARVVAGGFVDLGPFPDPVTARQHLPGLVSELQRLRHLATGNPHALAAARAHVPSRSKAVADELVDSGGRLIHALGATGRSDQLMRDLVRFASAGDAGWPSVVALLRTIDYDVEQADQGGSEAADPGPRGPGTSR